MLRQRDGTDPDSGSDSLKRARSSAEIWVMAAVKLLAVVGAAAIALRTPTQNEAWLATKNGVVAAAAVILIGKVVYDACFSDRFQP